MSLSTIKKIFAPLSSASDAMSDALTQAKSDLGGGLRDARDTLAEGTERSLRKAQKSSDRARRAWNDGAELARSQSQEAADQAVAKYESALGMLSSAWSRASQAFRDAGEQASDLEVRVRRDATRYSRQSASWARDNPHIIAAVIAVGGYFVIRSYRKRRALRLEADKDSVTNEVGNAANDEAVRSTRLA